MGSSASKTDKATIKEKRCEYMESIMNNESDTVCDEETEETACDEKNVSRIDPDDYNFPFENLVFEGGGAKGAAYWGAVKYLEGIELMPKIKRFAGASVGAISAMFLAVGFKSAEIQKYTDQNMEDILYDGGFFEIIPNILSHFGWHRGERFDKWLGDMIEKRTGSADITFAEVLRKYGRELCIVITNLNLMRTEYCHPKTTPDMPVRLAVRMSMSIPGLFRAKQLHLHGERDVFVDGGILCNFPLHCFDGWYLSMAKEDNFFAKIHGHHEEMILVYENRFQEETMNMKTLGLLVFSEKEGEVMRLAMEGRVKNVMPTRPERETQLYKKWMRTQEKERKAHILHEKLLDAANSFMKVLQKHNLDNNHVIDRKELEDALKDESFSSTEAEILFGKEMDGDVFDVLDHNKDGQIHYSELVSFLEDAGIFLHNHLFGYKQAEITDIRSFLNSVVDTFVTNMKRTHFKPRDVDRTVGINTGYIDTTDFQLVKEDKDFLLARGYNSCRSFLQRFVVDNQLEKKECQHPKQEINDF